MANTFQFKIFFNLIRSLFPKWNFFDKVAYTFALQYKVSPSSDWEVENFSCSRSMSSLLNNSVINELLAQFNIVEHFANDFLELQKSKSPIEPETVTGLTSYNLLCSLVNLKVKIKHPEANAVQFKIVATKQLDHSIDIYISDTILLEFK